jgi:hypothetical protein
MEQERTCENGRRRKRRRIRELDAPCRGAPMLTRGKCAFPTTRLIRDGPAWPGEARVKPSKLLGSAGGYRPIAHRSGPCIHLISTAAIRKGGEWRGRKSSGCVDDYRAAVLAQMMLSPPTPTLPQPPYSLDPAKAWQGNNCEPWLALVALKRCLFANSHSRRLILR